MFNGRISTAFTTEKMAVVAPIPIASVRRTTSVNLGVFAKARMHDARLAEVRLKFVSLHDACW
jgi:hypothetical protein